jgi:hypothetical protein
MLTCSLGMAIESALETLRDLPHNWSVELWNNDRRVCSILPGFSN